MRHCGSLRKSYCGKVCCTRSDFSTADLSEHREDHVSTACVDPRFTVSIWLKTGPQCYWSCLTGMIRLLSPTVSEKWWWTRSPAAESIPNLDHGRRHVDDVLFTVLSSSPNHSTVLQDVPNGATSKKRSRSHRAARCHFDILTGTRDLGLVSVPARRGV